MAGGIVVLPPKTTNNMTALGQLVGMIMGRNMYDKHTEKSLSQLSELFAKEVENIKGEGKARVDKIVTDHTGGYKPDAEGRVWLSPDPSATTTTPPTTTTDTKPTTSILPPTPAAATAATAEAKPSGIGATITPPQQQQSMPTADTPIGGVSLSEGLEAILGGSENKEKALQVARTAQASRNAYTDGLLMESARPAPSINQSALLKIAAKAAGLGMSPETAMKLVGSLAQDFNTNQAAERDTALKAQLARDYAAAGTQEARNAVLMKYATLAGKMSDVLNAANILSPHFAHYSTSLGGKMVSGVFNTKTGETRETEKPVTMTENQRETLKANKDRDDKNLAFRKEQEDNRNKNKKPTAEEKRDEKDAHAQRKTYYDLVAEIEQMLAKEEAAMKKAIAENDVLPSPDSTKTAAKLDELGKLFAFNDNLDPADQEVAKSKHYALNQIRERIYKQYWAKK